MVENHAMIKACEICNSEYLIDSKYCLACGSKNEEYTHLNKIKENVKNSEYYNIIAAKEIPCLDVPPYDTEPEPKPKPKPDTEEKICPNCGFKNLPDYSFCEECGTKLTDTEEKICPNCGFKNLPDYSFCEECGTKLTDTEEKIKTNDVIICQHCGAIADEDDNFCAECGQKL